MSGSFAGFSEDYIKKLQNGTAGNDNGMTKPPAKTKRPTRTKIAETKSKRILNSKLINEVIPEEAKLVDEKRNKNELNLNEQNVEETPKEIHTSKKPVDLKEFQVRQKLIEEQNRKRKELLSKALADRTKQTEEEAQRLNEIRGEFKKLDAVLSNDVKILRQQIEIASIDYMEAQKRYCKVEKEFLEAKLVLQQRLERKEMLTEHLCAIIEKTEERKAEKLTELLNKLDLKGDTVKENHDADVQSNEITSSEKQSKISS